MPNTGPPYEFEYEALTAGEEPGRTLHGATTGTSPILAEQVHGELDRVENTVVADIDERLADVEAVIAATRWRHIDEGSQVGGTSVGLVVPAGFKVLRLTLNGSIDTTTDLTLQVNGDASNNHLWSMVGWDGNGAQDIANHSAGSNAWRIGNWSTFQGNTSVVTMHDTNGAAMPGYIADAARVQTDPSAHERILAGGRFSQVAPITALTIGRVSGNFQSIFWVLEGYLA